jgi:hypothetical protein
MRLSRVASIAVGLMAVLLGIGQIILPRLAADRLRAELETHGHVLSVSVSAVPAIELLWGHADSVTVTMTNYGPADATHRKGYALGTRRAPAPTSPPLSIAQRIGDLLARTAGATAVTARIASFRAGRLVLTNMLFVKHGQQLFASALVTEAAVQATLPDEFSLRPVNSSTGQLRFRGGARVLDTRLSLVARLVARHGAVVVQPDVIGIFPAALSLTVFRAPQVDVESVGSRSAKSAWELSATGRLTQ